MDPFTALGAWGLTLVGIAALVRAARHAGALPQHERDALESDEFPSV